jgi:hypothetical protein
MAVLTFLGITETCQPTGTLPSELGQIGESLEEHCRQHPKRRLTVQPESPTADSVTNVTAFTVFTRMGLTRILNWINSGVVGKTL